MAAHSKWSTRDWDGNNLFNWDAVSSFDDGKMRWLHHRASHIRVWNQCITSNALSYQSYQPLPGRRHKSHSFLYDLMRHTSEEFVALILKLTRS